MVMEWSTLSFVHESLTTDSPFITLSRRVAHYNNTNIQYLYSALYLKQLELIIYVYTMHIVPRKHFNKLSSNSEAFISVLLKSFRKCFVTTGS